MQLLDKLWQSTVSHMVVAEILVVIHVIYIVPLNILQPE